MAAIFQRRKTTNGRRRNGHNEAHRYLNRELSWLDFNERVLAFAEDPKLPLLERAKFLAIFAPNLDEFFQIRVAGLKRQEAAGQLTRSTDGMTPASSWRRSGPESATRRIATRASSPRWSGPACATEGVPVVRWRELPEAAQSELRQAIYRADLPGPHPARRRPGPPVPVHLEPVAEPGGAGQGQR